MKKIIYLLLLTFMLVSCSSNTPTVCPDGSNSPTCENYHLNWDKVEWL